MTRIKFCIFQDFFIKKTTIIIVKIWIYKIHLHKENITIICFKFVLHLRQLKSIDTSLKPFLTLTSFPFVVYYLNILWQDFTFHPRNMRSCMWLWLKPERNQPTNNNNTSLNERFFCTIDCFIGFGILLYHNIMWLWSHLWDIYRNIKGKQKPK